MGPDRNSGDDRRGRIDAAVAEFLGALDAGHPLDPGAWLASHPDLATDLAPFLDGLHLRRPDLGPIRTAGFEPATRAFDPRADLITPDERWAGRDSALRPGPRDDDRIGGALRDPAARFLGADGRRAGAADAGATAAGTGTDASATQGLSRAASGVETEDDHRPPDLDELTTVVGSGAVRPAGPPSTHRDDGESTVERSARDLNATADLTETSQSSGFSIRPGDGALGAIGRFEILAELGSGAFGTVWKARDPALRRVVALKVPRRGALDPGEAERFFREARAAAQLRHPNIVAVHEVGDHSGLIYIVSDFVDGRTLHDVLQEGAPPFRQAATIVAGIARALHHAHEAGVVHRDLKPSNIMIDAQGQPIVMDFGLARRESDEVSLTQEGGIMGTPRYMSPEQAAGHGHHADRRSDVYSLGVVLFQLLTGEVPFRGTLTRLIAQIVEDEPPHPGRLNNLVPRDLATVCLKCLRKAPDRRYPTAEALADDLARWLRGEPIQAREVGRLERLASWCRRKPALAAMSAAAIALALCTFLAIGLGYYQTRLRLRDSLVNQARADRQTPDAGRSWSAAAALEDAARIRPGADIREEYLRVLDLPDFRFERLTPEPRFASKAPILVAVRDGRHALTITHGGELEEFDLATSTRRRAFAGLGKFTRTARLSPDGRLLAAVRDGRRSTEVWDIAAGKQLGTLKGPGGEDIDADALAFEPTSRRIAAVYWSDRTAPSLATFHPETFVADWVIRLPRAAVDSLNFVPDGGRLVLTATTRLVSPLRHEQRVEIYRPGHPEAIKLAVDPKAAVMPMNHDPRRVSFDVDARGTRMAVAGGGGWVKVWDLTPLIEGKGPPRETLAFKAHPDATAAVQFSPGGDSLATFGGDGTLRLWDAETGTPLVSGLFAPPGETPWLLARPQWIARDRIIGETMRGLAVWRVRTPLARVARIDRLDGVSPIPVPRAIGFAPSERWLVCSLTYPRSAVVELAARDAPPVVVPSGRAAIGFNAGSDRIIDASSSGVTIFDPRDGREVGHLPPPVGLDYFWGLGLDDRGHILVGANDRVGHMRVGRRFMIWDFDAGRSRLDLDLVREVADPEDPRRSIAIDPELSRDLRLSFSPDGTLACLQEHGAQYEGDARREVMILRLFDLGNGSLVDEFHLPRRGPVTLAAGGRLLAVGQGARIRLIDQGRSGVATTLETQETEVASLAVDAAGRRLASLAPREGIIRLWDVSRRSNVATFHTGRASAGVVALSSSGRWLASTDGMGRLRIWDLDEVRRVLGEAGLDW